MSRTSVSNNADDTHDSRYDTIKTSGEVEEKWSVGSGHVEDGGYIALVKPDMPHAMYITQLWEAPGGTQNHDAKRHLNGRQWWCRCRTLGVMSEISPLAIVAMSAEDSEMVEHGTWLHGSTTS